MVGNSYHFGNPVAYVGSAYGSGNRSSPVHLSFVLIFMKDYWLKWKKVAKKVAGIQANIVLTIIYILFIIPLSVMIRIFLKKSLYGYGYSLRKDSHWVKRREISQDIDWAQHQ